MATGPLLLPRLGETMEQGRVGRWLKRPGEPFRRGEILVEIESDKTTVDLPALFDGRLVEILVREGEEARVGAPLATVELAAAATPMGASAGALGSAVAPVAPSARPASGAVGPAARPATGRAPPLRATPRARRLATREATPLHQIAGTGRRGRVEVADVERFLTGRLLGSGPPPPAPAAPLPWPMVDFARFGPIRRSRPSRPRQLTGATQARSCALIPHATRHDEADVTDLEAFRARVNADRPREADEVPLLAFLLKACATALGQFPDLNASLDGEELVHKDYHHLGFVADSPSGPVAPVVRDVDRKGLLQLAREAAALAARARDGTLTPEDAEGGTFSVCCMGELGGTGFTPIINAPEVAILGTGRTTRRPIWRDGAFAPRLMLPLSVSHDLRVVDGTQAARFTVLLRRLLEDFRLVLV